MNLMQKKIINEFKKDLYKRMNPREYQSFTLIYSTIANYPEKERQRRLSMAFRDIIKYNNTDVFKIMKRIFKEKMLYTPFVKAFREVLNQISHK